MRAAGYFTVESLLADDDKTVAEVTGLDLKAVKAVKTATGKPKGSAKK